MHMAKRKTNLTLLFAAGIAVILAPTAVVQPGTPPDAQLIAQRTAIEKELQSLAIVERKLMIPMRDGKRMATDVYRPKDTSKK